MKSRHNRITNLWRRNPRCHYCGRLTVLIFRPAPQKGMRQPPVPPNKWEATIEHLNSRLSGNRCQTYDGVETTVLACWECNNKKAEIEQREYPLEKLQQRAGHTQAKTLERMKWLVDNGWEPWPDAVLTLWQDPYTKRLQPLHDAIHKQTRRDKWDQATGVAG